MDAVAFGSVTLPFLIEQEIHDGARLLMTLGPVGDKEIPRWHPHGLPCALASKQGKRAVSTRM